MPPRKRKLSGDKQMNIAAANDEDPQGKKKVLEPYIGDIDDPNIDDFVVDNLYLKTGFRIGMNTYKQAARSLFMVHNETMNIWSHLLGALSFLGVVFYVIVYLQPVSLHDTKPMHERWL